MNKEDIEYWLFKVRAGDKEQVEDWIKSHIKEILELALEGFEVEDLRDEVGSLEKDN